MSSIEEIKSDLEKLTEQKDESPTTVIFNKHRLKGKTALTEIVNQDDDAVSKTINKTDYIINLAEPIYIDRVYLYTQEIDKSINSKITLKYSDLFSSKESTLKASESIGDEHTYKINKVCTRLTISGTAAGFFVTKANIRNISIVGYKPEDLKSVEDAARQLKYGSDDLLERCSSKIEETENRLAALDNQILELNNEIEELEETKIEVISKTAELDKEIENLENSKENLRNQIKALNKNISEKEENIKRKDSQIIELNGIINDRESNVRMLAGEATNLNDEIKKLSEDKDIFAIELQDYIKQGRASKNQYLLLAALPLFVIISIALSLLTNSATLLQDLESTRPTWELLTTRVPFALISFALITASYKICAYFVKQLTHINNERLNMTKLQIIARDVTESSLEADISDPGLRQELRAKVKMAALKSYMRENLTEHFSHRTATDHGLKNDESTRKKDSEHQDYDDDEEEENYS
ncbi:hypothetical protein [Marinobacter nauticus]|uniref:hypothetical protein n=1 Tax=Marinobacter nauticus TaxID=2743 RepID=UPI0040440E0A